MLRTIGVLSFFTGIVQAAPNLSNEEIRLIRVLEEKGFKVIFEHPRESKAYGLFSSKEKILFISPLAYELGIGRSVLVHEAVHASQSCPSGVMSPVGWTLKVKPVVMRGITRVLTLSYHKNQHLEREALMMQAQPDAIKRVKKALEQRCTTR